MRNYLFVVNPNAQNGKAYNLWLKHKEIFENELGDIKVLITKSPFDAYQKVPKYVKEGYNYVIAVGGEGTSNSVINAVVKQNLESNVVFGLVPFGNMNDYALTMGLKREIKDSLDTILNGKELKVSLIKASTPKSIGYSLNVSSAGIVSRISKAHSYDREMQWVKGKMKYTLLALKYLIKWKNIPFQAILDNQKEIEGELTVILAGLSPTTGGYYLTPHGRPQFDRFAVSIGKNLKKREIIKLMDKAAKNELKPTPDLIFDYAKKMEIKTERPVILEVDGELVDLETHQITYEIVPNVIRFLYPKNSPRLNEKEEEIVATIKTK